MSLSLSPTHSLGLHDSCSLSSAGVGSRDCWPNMELFVLGQRLRVTRGGGGAEFRGTGLFLGEHLPWEAERLQAHSPLELASPRAASRAVPRGSLGSQL